MRQKGINTGKKHAGEKRRKTVEGRGTEHTHNILSGCPRKIERDGERETWKSREREIERQRER